MHPAEPSSKAWAATLALMEEADRARQAAARAEARLRHLQQRVAHEVELDAPRIIVEAMERHGEDAKAVTAACGALEALLSEGMD